MKSGDREKERKKEEKEKERGFELIILDPTFKYGNDFRSFEREVLSLLKVFFPAAPYPASGLTAVNISVKCRLTQHI
jgi:hypothetical protein